MQHSRRLAVGLSVVLLCSSVSTVFAQPADCRRAVNKNTAKLYKAVAAGAAKCMKAAIQDNVSPAGCYAPAGYDPASKLVLAIAKLADTLSLAPGSKCEGVLGLGFDHVCVGAPPACAAECVGCGTTAQIADCIACRVAEETLDQITAIYGLPPAGLNANTNASKCQNTIGKSGVKYGRTRLKDQQFCARLIDGNDIGPTTQCDVADVLGRTASADVKSSGKVVGTCLENPGADQIPALDTTAECLSSNAGTAAGCTISATAESIDSIFALVSEPASVSGVVMTSHPTNPNVPLLPLEDVLVSFPDSSVGVRTDENGCFRVGGLPNGSQDYIVDGRTAGSYPALPLEVETGMVGDTNVGIIPLPVVDLENAVEVVISRGSAPHARDGSVSVETTIDNPTIPGAEIVIPSGTTLDFEIDNQAPLLSISIVPVSPMPFPDDVAPAVVYTFQPEGLELSQPATVSFPNVEGFAPLSSVNIYRPDFATGTFEVAGTGTVSGDGTVIESDSAIIDRFDWYFPASPAVCDTTVQGRVVDSLATPVAGAGVCSTSVCSDPMTGAPIVSAADGTFSIPLSSCPNPVRVLVTNLLPTGEIQTGETFAAAVFDGITNVGDITIDFPLCGNGFADAGEECDDGNREPADGCSRTCTIELCGNLVIDPGEECDGEPTCTELCTDCGNNELRPPGEECDLGALNGEPGSGCSSDCHITICGNGIVEDDEACDDGISNGGKFSLCTELCQLQAVETLRFDLVRQGFECIAPNANSDEGVPACVPPDLESSFQFGETGQGSVFMGFTNNDTSVVVTANLTGIVQSDGSTLLSSASGWRLSAVLRVTLLDDSVGFTLADLALEGGFALTALGSLTGSVSLPSSLAASMGTFDERIVQLVDVHVSDPSGLEFASPGFAFPTSTPLGVDTPAGRPEALFGMVRVLEQCTAPNTAVAGRPACDPPVFASPYQLEDGAAPVGRYRSGNSDASFDVQLKGVLESDGVTPSNSPGFAAVMVVRMTMAGSVAPEATLIDFPVSVVSTSLKKGSGKLSTSLAEVWTNLFGAGEVLEGTTASMELVQSGALGLAIGPLVQDPAGDAFLGIGIAHE